MRSLIPLGLLLLCWIPTEAQRVSTHQVVFENGETQPTEAHREQLKLLLQQAKKGQRFVIYPLTYDDQHSSLRYAKYAPTQADSIAAIARSSHIPSNSLCRLSSSSAPPLSFHIFRAVLGSCVWCAFKAKVGEVSVIA